MTSTTKDGKTSFELTKPERKKLDGAMDVISGMREFTRLKDKAEAAIAAVKELLKEFEP